MCVGSYFTALMALAYNEKVIEIKRKNVTIAKRKKKAKKVKKAARKRKDYVVVSNRSYGNALKGTKIYFEGKKPKQLGDDGRIQFGKHILEFLNSHLKGERFRWIITQDKDEVKVERGIYCVRTSERFLRGMQSENLERSRDIKNDIVESRFASLYPRVFKNKPATPYVPGALAKTLRKDIAKNLSSDDKDAVMEFLPRFLSEEVVSSVNLLKAEAELQSLREVARYLEEQVKEIRSEHWWQTYVRNHILIIQQGYIKALDKLNVSLGDTKLPDFALVTHDMYLDILEIKKPNTKLLKKDTSRNNYYWDTEMTKAISQTENYVEMVARQADVIRSYLKDEHKLDMQVLKPRGIILAGNTNAFGPQKEKDDFRILASGLKNITVITYDELVSRLKNYIAVLEEHGSGSNKKVSKKKKRNRD